VIGDANSYEQLVPQAGSQPGAQSVPPQRASPDRAEAVAAGGRPPAAPESRRRELIAAIEAERDSKVIAYLLSDRRGAQAQIGEDAVRPMYDHLRALGRAKRIDLYLYSLGGATDVPWRIVTMIREFAEDFSVLIPYKAMSAATMVALGADEIVMGRKAELGPIDPSLSIERAGEGETAVQEQISVEDVMSYIGFLREKAGLTDQTALVGLVSALAQKVDPRLLGQINRMHSHIRIVARRLLSARSKQQAVDEQRIQRIVEVLAERTYQHGHAIGRHEAEEMGLNVMSPSAPLDGLMWELYEAYEEHCRLRYPVDPRTFIPPDADEKTDRVIMACIESVALAHHFSADLVIKNKRQIPPQVALNLNLNLQMPPNIQPEQLPAQAQGILQQMAQLLQQQAEAALRGELRRQMPVVGFEGWTQDAAWRPVDGLAGYAPRCSTKAPAKK
jgi:hypothetical protein